jgi:nucleoside-diphosphate-sugar epimerase
MTQAPYPPAPTFKKALVTGAGGFLGFALAKRLRGQGVAVNSLSRQSYEKLDQIGVTQYKGDLGDPQAVLKASEGCDIIFHAAAKVGIWGSYEDFYRTNVDGTRHILRACEEHRIQRLVYTSSPSVIFDGKDMEGVDESVPYPEHSEAHYPATKAIAEQAVLAANNERFFTLALRPHLIWGPEDAHLTPRILKRARQGRLRRIGDRDPLVDTVYIDNAVDAHLCAAHALLQTPSSRGRAYFITNDEPIGVWTMIDRILDAGGLPPLKKRISARAAYRIGALLESLFRLFRIQSEPPMTRFVAKELSTAHWFDISAAKEQLGYIPAIHLNEGLQRLKDYLHTVQNKSK